MQREPSVRRSNRTRNATVTETHPPSAFAQPSSLPTRAPSITRSATAEPETLNMFKMPAKPVSKISSERTSRGSITTTPRDTISKLPTSKITGLPQPRTATMPTRTHTRTQSLALPQPATPSSVRQVSIQSTPSRHTRTFSTASSTSRNGAALSTPRTVSSIHPPSAARNLPVLHKPSHSISSTPSRSGVTSQTSSHADISPPARTPSLKRTTSTTTPRHPTTGQTQSQLSSADHLRAQAHLLHLTLLHRASMRTLPQLTASARAALQRRHETLQALYTAVQALRQRVRRNRNILSLHAWTVGNTVALTRKISTLTGVLGDVVTLTEPDTGRFAAVVAAFGEWRRWVEGVWHARDVSGSGEGEEGSEAELVQISGLGDHVKSEIKAVQGIVAGMVTRIGELTGADKPVSSPRKTPRGEMVGNEERANVDEGSTLGRVLVIAETLVKGMQEELQMMREVEFEVQEGERMWREEKVRRVREGVGEW